MSHRIEQADPLKLLRELPNKWAQTCLTSPPPDVPVAYLLAVLEEVHRVLRPDGTVWLALANNPNAHELMWMLRHTRWLRPLPSSITPRNVLLLTKQPDFLFHPQHRSRRTASRRNRTCPGSGIEGSRGHVCLGCSRPRRAWCIPSPDTNGNPSRRVVEWCVLASTAPCACEVCGAPSRQTVLRREWCSTCPHKKDRGRCLVIDPFCTTGNTGIVAVGQGRHYLGIDPDPANAETARRRIARLLEHTR
jgi:hypothetical protein